MNDIFKPSLRKCVLVFFFLLSHTHLQPNLESHAQHLLQVFQLMLNNSLFSKRSKCYFATAKVEYLSHFISGKGVETDSQKIKAIVEWSIPLNIKQLRSFLGLAGYYRKFIKNYAWLSKPLTQLLKKGNFSWFFVVQESFEHLKHALSSAPVLALPDFSKTFFIKTDASQNGIGDVLMQQGRPLAFLSKALGPRWQKLFVYEKELLVVVATVQKWKH